MSHTIDEAFVRQYEADVHLAYQRMGTKLRATVRNKSGIVGLSTTFQKIGKGAAVSKARHADITPMNLEHSNVTCTLSDWYAGDFIDKLDELKTNINERQAVLDSGAFALGRKTDELIIDQLAATTTHVGDYSTALTRKLILDALEAAHAADWPEDGKWFGVVAPHAWGELLRLDEFSRSEFVGADGLPWKDGKRYRNWLGVNWMQHTGLPLASTDDRDCYLYHSSAVGHGSGAEVQSDFDWVGPKAAWFVNNMMSQGAVLIDASGVIEIRVDDNVAYS